MSRTEAVTAEEAVRTHECGGGTSRSQHAGVRAQGHGPGAWLGVGLRRRGEGAFPPKEMGCRAGWSGDQEVEVPVI